MSIYNVTRKVDTVILEMDISTAEKLLAVVNLVDEQTTWAEAYGSEFSALSCAMREAAEVRDPSPLYVAETDRDGTVIVRNITSEERDALR